jgi:SAM-dependent methyltransferase
MAETMGRHLLYQSAVQDVEAEIDFVIQTWGELRDRPARRLREDFCGTANTSCEWVRRGSHNRATGVDLDQEVLTWGAINNLGVLDEDQRHRVRLVQGDVREVRTPGMDVVLAMNFSYYLFMDRAAMLEYFQSVRTQLAPDGILFLDAYGGYEAPMVLEEPRDCDGFTYVWEQAEFNPIDSQMQCYIHFEFPDGSRQERAFSYRWRLWTLPELRECLLEAGFANAVVYWEGTDEETGEGDGIYTPSEVGDADPGWVCYLVAEA